MKQEKEKKGLQKKKLIAAGVILLLLLFLLFGLWKYFKSRNPVLGKAVPAVLTIETPPKKSAGDRENFLVDVTISALGEEVYPAASLNVIFDASRLEFMGVEEGNVMIPCEEMAGGGKRQLPEWQVDVEHCNRTGEIAVLYLDMTGGKYAFSQDLLEGEDNVLLRLAFRLRGSAKAGDIYELTVSDAVFAAMDSAKSLASLSGTLTVRDGRIVVE